jgi:hypothetical protein
MVVLFRHYSFFLDDPGRFVAKRYMNLDANVEMNHEQDLFTLNAASDYWSGFCNTIESHRDTLPVGLPNQVLAMRFVKGFLICVAEGEASSGWWSIEERIDGIFEKFNSNHEFGLKGRMPKIADTFSHYSAFVSKSHELVCDLQGMSTSSS